ncbi:hypothetical protein GCM10009737_08480 [Nocardioides lentus]|uniref:Uncharacterized protein n=1 Tax=Nocardioides lentus TaxID=338077 RepID=A0ABN2P388_9ACTN
MGDLDLGGGTLRAGGIDAPGVSAPLMAVTAANPAPPATTVSTTAVMAGLAVPFTPKVGGTGKVLVMVTGTAGTQTGASIASVSARYGTGTAPANGAAAAGASTPSGEKQCRAPAAATTPATPFAIIDTVTGLTAGTAYWLDLSYKTANAANAAVLGTLSVQIVDVQ